LSSHIVKPKPRAQMMVWARGTNPGLEKDIDIWLQTIFSQID
jgi:hypothetical protein